MIKYVHAVVNIVR